MFQMMETPNNPRHLRAEHTDLPTSGNSRRPTLQDLLQLTKNGLFWQITSLSAHWRDRAHSFSDISSARRQSSRLKYLTCCLYGQSPQHLMLILSADFPLQNATQPTKQRLKTCCFTEWKDLLYRLRLWHTPCLLLQHHERKPLV